MVTWWTGTEPKGEPTLIIISPDSTSREILKKSEVFPDDISRFLLESTYGRLVRIKSIFILIWLSLSMVSYSQNSRFNAVNYNDSLYQFSGKQLIVPVVLAGYGFAQFAVDPILDLNLKVRGEFTSRVKNHWHYDDYLQFVPAAAVYGLNILGIKGKHNFFDRSVIIGTSMVLMGASVYGVKQLTHIQRPDGTAFNSFPSGHTASAFACATFLYMEYKEVSVWYGIAGYTIAAGTGFFRMYNNRHWLTDVMAGAAFGIVSTRAAYWIFPKIKKKFFKNMQVNISWVPMFDTRYGINR